MDNPPSEENILLGKMEYVIAFYVAEGDTQKAEAVSCVYELLPDAPVLAVLAAENMDVSIHIIRGIRKVFGIVPHFL